MAPPKIESYRFGKIIIDGIHYQKDLIIFPDRILTGWWREQGHSLSINDLREVITAKPDTLIIGTGAAGRLQIASETLANLEEFGFETLALKSGQACELYNQCREDRKVILAIHLTC